ncbi:MAG: hypothetical protein KDN20_13800 [Verrucomicrobiae bacterium]|nr:hypothetical protein [Verrucomicrobiae bacterium]
MLAFHVDARRADDNPEGSRDARRFQGPVRDDVTFGQLGGYLQETAPLLGRLGLLLGGRYTGVGADVGRSEEPISLVASWA